MAVYNEKILIADSEIEVRKILAAQFNQLGYGVTIVSNWKDALVSLLKETPDLVIIDLFLTKENGYSVCRKIRENYQIPIIIIAAAANISDCSLGLQVGANDYLVKPFFQKELECKVKDLLSCCSYKIEQNLPKTKPNNLQINDFILEMDKQILFRKNLKIKLTALEYAILKLLIDNSGKKLSRTMILNNVWGYIPERYVDTRIVDVHISRLRAKIEKNPRTPDLILTIRGIGYMFQKNND